jgi:hypothetical protein
VYVRAKISDLKTLPRFAATVYEHTRVYTFVVSDPQQQQRVRCDDIPNRGFQKIKRTRTVQQRLTFCTTVIIVGHKKKFTAADVHVRLSLTLSLSLPSRTYAAIESVVNVAVSTGGSESNANNTRKKRKKKKNNRLYSYQIYKRTRAQ